MFHNFFREIKSSFYYESTPLNQTPKPFINKDLLEVDNSLRDLITDAEEIKSDLRFIKENLDKIIYQKKYLHI